MFGLRGLTPDLGIRDGVQRDRATSRAAWALDHGLLPSGRALAVESACALRGRRAGLPTVARWKELLGADVDRTGGHERADVAGIRCLVLRERRHGSPRGRGAALASAGRDERRRSGLAPG